MSEMVERVAAALEAFCAERYGKHFAYDTKDIARAAIEAMREPTMAMLEEGHLEFDHHRNQYATWRDMVDEALK